jgi:hypothetical protein
MSLQEKPQVSGQELADSLRQFQGDLLRYRHWLCRKVLYSPGIAYLAETASAYWLIDAIASWLGSQEYCDAINNDLRIEQLHFWRLEVRSDRSAVLIARADRGEKPFISQTIPFTDFPLGELDVWVAYDGSDWTIYLPSEH